VGGHHKPLWSRFRTHAAGSRDVVSVDERGEVTMIPAEPNWNSIRIQSAATIFLLADRGRVLDLSRNVEEHLSLVIGNANCPYACVEAHSEQHRGGNVDLGSEPHCAWIVDRVQLVTEHYGLLRL
jgi:hypothetical protein